MTGLPDPHLRHDKTLSEVSFCWAWLLYWANEQVVYKPIEAAVVAGRFMLHLQNLDYLGEITYDLLTVMSLANSSFSIQIQWACLLHALGFSPVSHFHTSTDRSCLLFKLITTICFRSEVRISEMEDGWISIWPFYADCWRWSQQQRWWYLQILFWIAK